MNSLCNFTRLAGAVFVDALPRLTQNAYRCIKVDNHCSQVSYIVRNLHTSSELCKERDRRYYLKGYKPPDQGTEGEHFIGVDANIKRREDMFIDENTPNLLFNGIKFSEVPICHVSVTKNNTKVHITDHKGDSVLFRSCGVEGFKNARKGTNVAAQATALTLSKKAVQRGLKDVRLKIQGLGPGRMSSVKGLVMGGLNIISVTDYTRIAWGRMNRPRKARRV